MRKETIHIACALDDNFLMTTGVMLVSLFETNKANKIHIHIFSANLNEENVNHLKAITERYGGDFEFYHLASSIFENFNFNERISLASYYRILIPEIINKNINKILYLDGDMIVNGDLLPLWETDLNDYVIGASDDIVAIDVKEFYRLEIPKEFGYFNAGMVLINTEKWRNDNTTQKVLTFLTENKEIIKFHDQDGLNKILFDKVKKLPVKWNQQVGIYCCKPNFIRSVFPGMDLEKTTKNPVIVHFNGKEKPWNYVSLHPFTKMFKYYLKLSGLKNNAEKITLKKFLKKQAYRLLGWKRLNRYFYNKQKLIQYGKEINN
jgi:lipopolysaccharide biosynthesis glycosyltransferase